jgi:hypothetical protein
MYVCVYGWMHQCLSNERKQNKNKQTFTYPPTGLAQLAASPKPAELWVKRPALPLSSLDIPLQPKKGV